MQHMYKQCMSDFKICFLHYQNDCHTTDPSKHQKHKAPKVGHGGTIHCATDSGPHNGDEGIYHAHPGKQCP